MAIVLFTSPPDVTSRVITLNMSTGRTLTVHGSRNYTESFAICIAPTADQSSPYDVAFIRTKLHRLLRAEYDKAKVAQTSSLLQVRIAADKALDQIRQANNHRFPIAVSGMRRDELQEGDTVTAFVMGYSGLTLPLGILDRIS